MNSMYTFSRLYCIISEYFINVHQDRSFLLVFSTTQHHTQKKKNTTRTKMTYIYTPSFLLFAPLHPSTLAFMYSFLLFSTIFYSLLSTLCSSSLLHPHLQVWQKFIKYSYERHKHSLKLLLTCIHN